MTATTTRLTGLILLIMLVVLAGCKDSEVNGETGEAAVAEAEEVIGEEGVDVPVAHSPTADLAFYPMPADLPGQEMVVGDVRIAPEIQKPTTGGDCPVRVSHAGETIKVTILSMTLNCCTEGIKPSVEIADGVVEVRLYEYLPDVCECLMQRSVMFQLTGFDPTGLEFRIYSNADGTPCHVGVAVDEAP
jgi:hypothetical protein